MNHQPIFQVIRESDGFRVLIDGGSCRWQDDKTVKEFFRDWMKDNKLVKSYDKFGLPEQLIIK